MDRISANGSLIRATNLNLSNNIFKNQSIMSSTGEDNPNNIVLNKLFGNRALSNEEQ